MIMPTRSAARLAVTGLIGALAHLGRDIGRRAPGRPRR